MLRERIIEATDKWRMNAAELSRLTGISPSMVWRYLKNKSDLNGKMIDKLLIALNLYVAPRVLKKGYISTAIPPERRDQRERPMKKPPPKRPRKGQDIFDD